MSTERKKLVWEIKKELYTLTTAELFELTQQIQSPALDSSMVTESDEESCFDYINSYMLSQNLLAKEDEGFSQLLELKDVVLNLKGVKATVKENLPVNVDVDVGRSPGNVNMHDLTAEPHVEDNWSAQSPLASKHQGVTHDKTSTESRAEMENTDYQKLLSSYEELSQKLAAYHPPTASTTPDHPSSTQPPCVAHDSHMYRPVSVAQDRTDAMFSLRDLSLLQRREFKIHGGQVGDHSSDISYSSLCKQIEEGLKSNHTESEIIQGVFRVIKPGVFKEKLIHMDKMSLAELKSFIQSHLSERNSTELFQELMSTRQHDHETPQQFLYRVIGLKQKVLFASRRANADIEYDPRNVQTVFLKTIHQGLSLKYSEMRTELKPLLADQSVTDEMLLKQVIKAMSEENERQRRLGQTTRQRATAVRSAKVDATQETEQTAPDPKNKGKIKTIQDLTAQVEALTNLVESLARSRATDSSTHSTERRPAFRREVRPRGCSRVWSRASQTVCTVIVVEIQDTEQSGV